ncbi:MAG: Ig-like domain-containing protein, partial [Clostridia bacterium]|nr:Ig-like domain-containing protein [Clostridia bacterium]
ATNIDADGNVKYNETDYYGTYNGQKGYIDANGYFYDANHAYVVTDQGLVRIVTIADADGYAMADATKYYGKLTSNYHTDYAYLIKRKDKFYWYTSDDTYHVSDGNFYGTIKFIDDDGYAMSDENTYYGRYKRNNNSYVYGVLEVHNGRSYLKVDGKYIAEDGNSYEFMDENGHFKYDADSEFYYGKTNSWDNSFTPLNKDGCPYDQTLDANGNPRGYYLGNETWRIVNQGYSPCEDATSPNYGYYVDSNGDAYINYFATGADKRLKAWGYTSEEISALISAGKIGLSESNSFNSSSVIVKGTFLEAAPEDKCEKFTVQEGEPISVEKGEIDKAISSEDINGLEGQFITPKEIEKIKAVTETVGASDALEKVTVKQASPVQFYNFTSGVVLPNNGIWFKPSIAGKIRLVMYAENAGDGFSLIQGHRTSATAENPFTIDYSQSGADITVREIAKCGLPSRVLFYFEYEISQEEIDDGRYEYWILQNDGGGTGKDPGGAYFVYLDLGASAPDDEDTSGVLPDKVSAVDFIYDGVEITQEDVADTDIKIGDFIVNTSGKVDRYASSRTSVYFDGITKGLKVVYVRLHNDEADKHSGKTICLEYTKTADLDEVYATYATYVCPTIKGGSGTVGGGGGGGPVTPTPGPDDVAVTGVTISNAPTTMTVGGTATLTATVAPDNATDKTVTWTTSDSSIATVANGVVTAKAAGTVTITATAGGKSDSVSITVSAGGSQSGQTVAAIESFTGVSGESYDVTITDAALKNMLVDNKINIAKTGSSIGLDKNNLKVESATKITFNTAADLPDGVKLVLKLDVSGSNSNTIKINNQKQTATDGVITYELEKGKEYVIGRDSGNTRLISIEFIVP